MIIKKTSYTFINIIVIIFLWLNLFFDSYSENILINALMSTIRIGCFVLAYYIYLYYHSYLKTKKYSRIKLFFWFIVLTLTLHSIEIINHTIENNNRQSAWLNDNLYIKKGDSYVLVHKKENIIEQEKENPLIIFDFIFSFILIFATMMFARSKALLKDNKQQELDISKLKALNKESELKKLKNQINPHFLFNALSNIYSIAYLGDKETPDKIMQLSKMLRYVIYDTDTAYIKLNKEIEYLIYYIDFQKFKIKKEQQIEFNYEGYNTNLTIAPMLLQAFVENAFKHSQVSSEAGAWVKINLETKENNLFFSVENTISKQNTPEILDNAGIGLENIQKRLKLIYKDRYELKIKQNKNFYIQLKITDK